MTTDAKSMAEAYEKKVLSNYGVIVAPSIDYLAGFKAALECEEVKELIKAERLFAYHAGLSDGESGEYESATDAELKAARRARKAFDKLAKGEM